MENFKEVIERRSPFSIKLLTQRYVATHLDQIKSLLNREDAVASHLDMGSHRQYVSDLKYNWQDDLNMGCCVVRKEDQAEKPIAVAIASASAYRADVRRLTELNWRRTNAYREKEDQWCLDYLVRAREFRGRGVGCFALVGLMECFCSRFGDAVLWLSLAGGFSNRNTLSLYTDVGFFVMSLDSDKNPIMLLQVHDIGQRARRKLVDTLTLRHGAAAAEQGGGGGAGGGGGGGGDGGGGDGGRPPYNLRRGRRQIGRRGDGRRRRGHRDDLAQVVEPRLRFRTMEQQLTLSNVQLVLPPRAEGLEQDLVRHLWSMSEMAALNPGSQALLIHLNLAKQCHHIAHQRRLHVSRWITEQRAEHREDEQWNRRFASLANDVLLLWGVFTMPCLELLDIGYAAASRPGGVKDIVRLCRQLAENGDPLPHPILEAQAQMHK
jgi:hypothetical protein